MRFHLLSKLNGLTYCLLAIMFFIFVFLPSYSIAEDGKMVVIPSITPEWRYDSNYYKSEELERAVSTYSIKPGINMGYKTPKTTFALDGFLDFQRYNDEDDVPAGLLSADEDDYTEELLGVTAESQLFDRLSFGIDAGYMNTREAAESDIYSNSTKREEFTISRVAPKVTYRFGEKFGLLSSYANSSIDYDRSNASDSTQNRGKFDLFYNLNTNTSFDLDYQVWSRDYDMTTTSDYTSQQLMINMNKQYKYFSISGGIGYQERSFDVGGKEDIDALAWQFSLTGQSSSSEEIELTGESARSRMMLSLSQNLNDVGTDEEYYTATRVDAKVSRLFMTKLDTSIKGFFQNSDYELITREDDTWNIAAEIKYLMKEWLIFSLESGYETRDSNYYGEDYDANYAMFNVQFIYNLGSR